MGYFWIRTIFIKGILLLNKMERYSRIRMGYIWMKMVNIKGSLRMDSLKDKVNIISLLVILIYNNHHYYQQITTTHKHYSI